MGEETVVYIKFQKDLLNNLLNFIKFPKDNGMQL